MADCCNNKMSHVNWLTYDCAQNLWPNGMGLDGNRIGIGFPSKGSAKSNHDLQVWLYLNDMTWWAIFSHLWLLLTRTTGMVFSKGVDPNVYLPSNASATVGWQCNLDIHSRCCKINGLCKRKEIVISIIQRPEYRCEWSVSKDLKQQYRSSLLDQVFFCTFSFLRRCSLLPCHQLFYVCWTRSMSVSNQVPHHWLSFHFHVKCK